MDAVIIFWRTRRNANMSGVVKFGYLTCANEVEKPRTRNSDTALSESKHNLGLKTVFLPEALVVEQALAYE